MTPRPASVVIIDDDDHPEDFVVLGSNVWHSSSPPQGPRISNSDVEQSEIFGVDSKTTPILHRNPNVIIVNPDVPRPQPLAMDFSKPKPVSGSWEGQRQPLSKGFPTPSLNVGGMTQSLSRQPSVEILSINQQSHPCPAKSTPKPSTRRLQTSGSCSPNDTSVVFVHVNSNPNLDDDVEEGGDGDFMYVVGEMPDVVDLEKEEDRLYSEILHNSGGSHAQPDIPSRRQTDLPRRNLSLLPTEAALQQVLLKQGSYIRLGKTVELLGGGFILVTKIVKDCLTGEISIRGHSLQRWRDTNGVLPAKLNELCWALDVDLDDCRSFAEQGVVQTSLREVTKIRKLNITNAPYPEHTFRDTLERSKYADMEDVEANGPLALRVRFVCFYQSANMRRSNQFGERAVEYLREVHLAELACTKIISSDDRTRDIWRGTTIPGGSFCPTKKRKRDHYQVRELGQMDIIDLSDEQADKEILTCTEVDRARRSTSSSTLVDEDRGHCKPRTKHAVDKKGLQKTISRSNSKPLPVISPGDSKSHRPKEHQDDLERQYTFGDAFCGAGGTTSGADQAGHKVVWGCDNNDHAAASWILNFPNAVMYKEHATSLCIRKIANVGLKVDILHLSPPCQFFSPAHTCVGMNDDENFSIIFSCGHILDAAKPRMGTLEQTFGIGHPIFRQVFNALINMFTSRGYSVRWKIAQLQDWGLPQRRRRMVIFFAGPGEPLPQFPPVTHGEGGSDQAIELKPYNSVNRTIASIPRHHTRHDVEHAISRHMPRWDGDGIAPRCITTSGGQNYHPRGHRDFTLAEFMVLQGFPLEHQFSAFGIKRQIGNAVPPTIAKIWHLAIREALQEVDGVACRHNNAPEGAMSSEILAAQYRFISGSVKGLQTIVID